MLKCFLLELIGRKDNKNWLEKLFKEKFGLLILNMLSVLNLVKKKWVVL